MKTKSDKKTKQTAYFVNVSGMRATAAALLALGGTWAFPYLLSVSGDFLEYANSILSVFLFLGLFVLVKKALAVNYAEKERGWFYPGLAGGLFSLCMVFGSRLDLKESVPFKEGKMWLGILIWAVLFTIIIRYFWEIMAGRKQVYRMQACVLEAGSGIKKKEDLENTFGQRIDLRSLGIRAAVIFLCFFPVFLAVYPGFFVYDAQEEYLQVVTRNFTTHHPLIHVLLLGGLIQLVYKVSGSVNLGIACYTILQMTVMSVIFAWCVEKLKQRGMRKSGRVLLTLYFGLCPVLVMFSLCSAKDGLFTGMLLIMVVLLQELCKEPEAFLKNRRKMTLMSVSTLGMMLLRHNGFYAFFVFTLLLIIYLRKEIKKALIYPVGIILIYLLCNAALTGLFHADHSESQEMLTVPISQMARVYADEKDTLPVEEKEIFYRYLSEEALAHYTPKVSDGVKIHFNNEAFAADKGSFFKLWAKWGASHPFTYLNAWFMTSYGFWYPDTVIDVYRGNTVFTFTYGDSSYFGYEVEEPGSRESKMPWLNELYRKMSLEIFQQKIPVVSMLFSPGFFFWVMMFLLGYLCYLKEYKRVLPFALPLLCWLTVILGPTYLVRYVVFLWVAVPLLLWEVNCCKFDNWK